MSKTINRVKHFVLLLLDKSTSKEQAKALLETATLDQVNAVSEITYNLLSGNLPLNSKVNSILKKRKRVLNKLANKSISQKERSCIILQHTRLILDTLLLNKSILLRLLKQ